MLGVIFLIIQIKLVAGTGFFFSSRVVLVDVIVAVFRLCSTGRTKSGENLDKVIICFPNTLSTMIHIRVRKDGIGGTLYDVQCTAQRIALHV